ncbi:MAG: ribonuclease J [Anaerolineae bacterium]|nr:MAG: ribonuclease J [Anaerolineae bacterium]
MSHKLRIIPLGGLGEVGKNMMVLEYNQNILIIDAGLMFPENDMLGIDLVIPDYGYLADKKDWVRAIIVTHGHEDHTGALPFLMRDLSAPIYTTRLTRGLIEVKLKQSHLLEGTTVHTIQPGDRINIGPFDVEFFHVCHSIPDGVGLAIDTPVGLVVHSGDFKFDHTPVDGKPTDFAKLAELGGRHPLVLMADSTNAERPGATPSEKVIDAAFDQVFREAKGRVIVATFASLISRIQQVFNAAPNHDRQVAITGYTMGEYVKIAKEMGYLDVPPGVLAPIDRAMRLPPERLVILATGTQGEPSSALARMAMDRHRHVKIQRGDTVIHSAHPIPGNEEMVGRTINRLIQRGAHVLYSHIAPVHVSGHASSEEQRLLLNVVRPKFFVPIHGELRHLTRHAQLAHELGMPPENTFVVENGYILEFDRQSGSVGERVPGGYVFVDGSGVGDVGPAVLRDREILARDGFVVAFVQRDAETGQLRRPPDIVSRGFVFLRDSDELLAEAGDQVQDLVASSPPGAKSSVLEDQVRALLTNLLYQQTKRRPMIIPVVTEH